VTIDLTLLHAINGLCGRWWLLDELMWLLGGSSLTKGVVYIAAFWWLSFQPSERQSRYQAIFATTVLGVVAAIVIDRGIALLLPFRSRPMYTADIGYHTPLLNSLMSFDLENWSSFPSDQASYFFAMSTGLWLCGGRLGAWFTAYSFLNTVITRLYFGIHYPTDLLVGALIGATATAAVHVGKIHVVLTRPASLLARYHLGLFFAAMFIVSFEMANLFEDIRWFGRGLIKLFLRYRGFF
jgi:undecaprenyl-diphosphatase